MKINGVRVELREIEHAILDDVAGARSRSDYRGVVSACVVTATSRGEHGRKKPTAYCVLTDTCAKEIGLLAPSIPSHDEGTSGHCPPDGTLCTPSPLLTLLRTRCALRLRTGCTPSAFVLIPKIPLTHTGKRDHRSLPHLQSCPPLPPPPTARGHTPCLPLEKHGRSGATVSSELVACLNLQVCQRSSVTTGADFAALGGDSLSALRVVRGLYALHHGVHNSRNLGGVFGSLEVAVNSERDGAETVVEYLSVASFDDSFDG